MGKNPEFPTLPVKGQDYSLRIFFNEHFPELTIDPTEIFAQVENGVFESVMEIMDSAGIHTATAKRIQKRKEEEFQVIIPMAHDKKSARFVIEHGTGHKISIIPMPLIAGISEQLRSDDPHLDDDEALRRGSRMVLAYSYGLLAFDDMDPWEIVDSEVADDVAKRAAMGLLCSGIDDGSQELSITSKPDYMHDSLPLRFATAVAYLDAQKYLKTKGIEDEMSRAVIDSFIESRLTAVLVAKMEKSLAISELDLAFAHPLLDDEFRTFVAIASVLRERGHLRALR